jgi:hypothetical protein
VEFDAETIWEAAVPVRTRLTRSFASQLLSLVVTLACIPAPTAAQTLPAPDDSRHSMLREAMLGLLPSDTPAVSADATRKQCLSLPTSPPAERIEGPHGDSLLSSNCSIVEYASMPVVGRSAWTLARYRWISTFTAEDTTHGPLARDTVTEQEVVLFEAIEAGQLHPVWHARFEEGAYAVLRSVTPSLAPTEDGGMLLSVQSCLNGTGGCGQEFLRRTRGGAWQPVWQTWYDELPKGGKDRIWHGAQIDPKSLRVEAGFYGPNDSNCCPSERLEAQLRLQGDSLVLKSWQVKPETQR